jgi:hypothetical protein
MDQDGGFWVWGVWFILWEYGVVGLTTRLLDLGFRVYATSQPTPSLQTCIVSSNGVTRWGSSVVSNALPPLGST